MEISSLFNVLTNVSDMENLRKVAQHMNLTEEQLEQYLNYGAYNQEVHHFRSQLEDSCYENPDKYCNGSLKDIALAYKGIHGYFSLAVCFFGVIANALNVAVLTRREMSHAPINRILTALAMADIMVMLEYVPFAVYMYLIFPDSRNFPFSSAVLILFHVHFSQVLHTISICLTLTLAVWRYISIRYPQKTMVLCSEARCNLAIAISYMLPIILCLPSYFVFHIRATTIKENNVNVVLYHLDLNDIARVNDRLLCKITFWTYGVVIKLIPCVILTLISWCLIQTLHEVTERSLVLRGQNRNCGVNQSPYEQKRIARVERRADRTTRMLIAVLLLFLLTEFPQSIFGLLSGALGTCFFRHCYNIFGELMDVLALLNGAINFILYCSMNRQFRVTFKRLFKPRRPLVKFMPRSSQTELQSTYV